MPTGDGVNRKYLMTSKHAFDLLIDDGRCCANTPMVLTDQNIILQVQNRIS